jgi:cellulose synthase/poly-beta-1,6-N-acetylglucosamine synthase-like glycosyltransferase
VLADVSFDLRWPFENLPWPLEILFTAAFVVVVVNLVDIGLLAWWGGRSRRHAPELPERAPDLVWVFLVAALDEEAVIADSVGRLLGLDLDRRLVVVIDDASTDATAEILDGIDAPDLLVLHRRPPDARRGKAAALNYAWRHLTAVEQQPGGRLHGVASTDIVVVVVDADGRLDPDAPAAAGAHFADPEVGGLQVLVRIYNRRVSLLVRLQDMEFGVFGALMQLGRTWPGTAGLGGNGQFTRFAALAEIAEGEGPWRDRLTEDQDLGLRLLRAGWRIHQDTRTAVHQQGLRSLRRLWKQRTRWAQGNLQAMRQVGVLAAPGLGPMARLDLAVYLFQPLQQALVGTAFVASLVAFSFFGVRFWDGADLTQLGFFVFLALAFVAAGALSYARVSGTKDFFGIVLLAIGYAAYAWVLWPALTRAAGRQLIGRTGWAKTQREVAVPPGTEPAS